MNLCSYCRQPIPDGQYPYTLRLELFPAIEPSLQISEAEMAQDHRKELERLMEIMAAMTDDEVIEQEKLMHVSHVFTLCRPCRDRLALQLDRLKPPES